MNAPHAAITLVLAVASASFLPTASRSVAQRPEQQHCIRVMNEYGARALELQGKTAQQCLRNGSRGKLAALGVPPQAQTAQACLANDVRGKLAKQETKTVAQDLRRCRTAPEQLPDFAYTGAVRVSGPGRTAALGLVRDLFGDALEPAGETDRARCQEEVLRRSFRLVDRLRRNAARHARNVLKGKKRLVGDPPAPVASSGEFAAEIAASILADAGGGIAKAQQKLVAGTAKRCSVTAASLGDLFPGRCSASADVGELAHCAARSARLAFWTSLASFDALHLSCDLLDDGEENDSCAPGPRNVVLILSDDQGWGDVGFHSTADPFTTIPTPRLDSLAQEGIELTHFMVQPVCSPTRAEILTGRSATRVGVAPGTINPRNGQHMSLDEVTLAEAFRDAGYDTGIVGKWHLGTDEQGPLTQGFDHFAGILRAAADYFTRMDEDELLWQENGVYLDRPGYTTDLIASEAVAYLDGRGSAPFFLYVPFTAPHNPQQAKLEDLARVPDEFDAERETYAAMVLSLDDGIGRILDALDANGLAANTVVFFASDNGGGRHGNNLPLRGGKHNAYDGGVRVPAAIRIPGILSGSTSGMIAAADIYPTVLSLAGVAPPPGPTLDGEDVSAGIVSAASELRSETAWIRKDHDAYRTPEWKLIRRPDGHRELYDLVSDPFESADLAGALPETVASLEASLDAWNQRVVAAPSHVPLAAGTASPSGDVIRAVIDAGAAASGDLLQVQLSRAFAIQVHPGDVLEYDMRIEPGTRANGFVLDLLRTNDDVPWGDEGLSFRDQDNHNVGAGEAFTAAVGGWARRTIGLGGLGASNANACKLMFLDLSPGRYEVLLDNIVIHRFDGSDVVIYADGPIPDLDVVDAGTADVTTEVTVVPLQ